MDLGPAVSVNLGGINAAPVVEEVIFESFELDQPPQVEMRVPPVYPFKAREQVNCTRLVQTGFARIKSLVSSAVGLDNVRGDSIEVSSIAFGAMDMSEGPSLVRNFIEMGQRLGKPLLTGLLIFLFLILVVRPVVMALIRPKVAEEEVEEVASLPSHEERLAIEEALEVPEEALDTSRRLENAKNLAVQLTDQNMDAAIRLLKSWARQEA